MIASMISQTRHDTGITQQIGTREKQSYSEKLPRLISDLRFKPIPPIAKEMSLSHDRMIARDSKLANS
jgi:hypothetical protein